MMMFINDLIFLQIGAVLGFAALALLQTSSDANDDAESF
jgi:hypothetical protein